MAEKGRDENNGGSVIERWGFYLIAIGIPLAIVALWHTTNTAYPNDDCANYFETAQDIYFRFKQGGVIDGLWASYAVRGWRPLLFPLMAVPFIAVTSDNILLATALTLGSLYFLFLTYAYMTAREYITPARACLATVFVATIPWLVNFAYYFMSEMALMACSMAALYHLKKADMFASRRHSIFAAVWLGLGFAVRPVEFTLAFGLLAAALIYLSWRKGIISGRDVAATLSAVVLMLALFLAAAKGWIEHRPALRIYGAVLLLITALPLVFNKKWKLHAPYQWAVFICNMMIIVWWLPYMKNLYDWIQETTGVVGQLYHDRGQMSFIKAVYAFFSNLGGWPLLVTLGLFAAALAASRRKKTSALTGFLAANGAAISMIIPPVFMLSLTTDIAYRRAFAGFAVLLLVNGVFAAHHELILPRARYVLVAILASAQIALAYAYTFNTMSGVTPLIVKFYETPGNAMKGGDPSERFYNRLKRFPFKGHTEIAAMSLSQTQYQERPFDTSALNVVAKKDGSDIRFSYPAVFFSLEEGYALLHKNWKYAVLDVSTGNPASDPYSRLTADMIERWRRGDLSSVGLVYAAEIHVPAAWLEGAQPSEKTIILLEMTKDPAEVDKDLEKIAASSVLQPGDKDMQADRLMETNKVIWHAQSPPKYPEWLRADYSKPKRFNRIALRAQEISPKGDEYVRGPKDFTLQASNDAKRWKDLLRVKDNTFTHGGQWKEWALENDRAFSHYRILITASGHPELLTLKQIRLTEVVADPVARHAGVEGITASSNLFPGKPGLSAGLLMEENKTIWHARRPPKYPEWVRVVYGKPERINHLELRSQESSPGGSEHTRGVRDFRLQASSDGRKWKDLLDVKNNVFTGGGQWKQWDFKNDEGYRYYRIYMTAGNDPNLLTLTQMRLSERKLINP
ncbi:MAG: discoidin domain-containing protein [Deltaproteobacteria bacterium]|nr:discoidin domain-containing protein [Deltaproteobacteria bacterium]